MVPKTSRDNTKLTCDNDRFFDVISATKCSETGSPPALIVRTTDSDDDATLLDRELPARRRPHYCDRRRDLGPGIGLFEMNEKHQQWKHPEYPKLRKLKQTISVSKVKASIVWDRIRLLLCEFMPKLWRTFARRCRTREEAYSRKDYVHQNNARLQPPM
ncbi:hypothetical protein Trydic_g3903 [Trypoxylus dichotomus]